MFEALAEYEAAIRADERDRIVREIDAMAQIVEDVYGDQADPELRTVRKVADRIRRASER